jgi:aspartate kinase
LIVAKIGGSCLSSGKGIEKTTEIVKNWIKEEEKPIIVVSALKGVTDELLLQTETSLKGSFNLKKIKNLHEQYLNGLNPNIKKQAQKGIKNLLKELEESLLRVTVNQKANASDRDGIISYGEKLASLLITAHLNDCGIDAKPHWDVEAGIVTNSNYGNASILTKSISLIRKKLDVSYVPVVSGFFGRDENGQIATLGRGGSDYIATFISSAMNCPVILFKDVDGFMTADPKTVEKAQIIHKIKYEDALELAYYGAKVINEKAIMPAIKTQTPIKITNFFFHREGTTIGHEGVINAISHVLDVIKMNIFYSHENLDILMLLLSELCVLDIDPLIISKVSRSGFSIVVKEREVETIEKIIQKMLKEIHMDVQNNIGLVTVLGNNVEKIKIGNMYKLLLDNKIEINSVNKSSNSKKLCILVNKQDVKQTVKLLHKIFIENFS